MDSYYPGGARKSIFTTYGYSAGELLIQVLKPCGDELSRERVMRQATNLRDGKLDLLLPDLSVNTSRVGYRVVKEFQMMRLTGARWEPFGPIVSD
jgi:branched-chain amino acid transport system substrate-binding protein